MISCSLEYSSRSPDSVDARDASRRNAARDDGLCCGEPAKPLDRLQTGAGGQHVDPPEFEKPYAFQSIFLPHSQQPLSLADGELYAFHDTWVPRSPVHLGELGPASSVYNWAQSLSGNLQIYDLGSYGPLDAQGGGVDAQGPLDVLQERTEEEWGELEERLAAELHATLGRTANSGVA